MPETIQTTSTEETSATKKTSADVSIESTENEVSIDSVLAGQGASRQSEHPSREELSFAIESTASETSVPGSLLAGQGASPQSGHPSYDELSSAIKKLDTQYSFAMGTLSLKGKTNEIRLFMQGVDELLPKALRFVKNDFVLKEAWESIQVQTYYRFCYLAARIYQGWCYGESSEFSLPEGITTFYSLSIMFPIFLGHPLFQYIHNLCKAKISLKQEELDEPAAADFTSASGSESQPLGDLETSAYPHPLSLSPIPTENSAASALSSGTSSPLFDADDIDDGTTRGFRPILRVNSAPDLQQRLRTFSPPSVASMQNFSHPPSQTSAVAGFSAPQSPHAEDGDSSASAAGTSSPSAEILAEKSAANAFPSGISSPIPDDDAMTEKQESVEPVILPANADDVMVKQPYQFDSRTISALDLPGALRSSFPRQKRAATSESNFPQDQQEDGDSSENAAGTASPSAAILAENSAASAFSSNTSSPLLDADDSDDGTTTVFQPIDPDLQQRPMTLSPTSVASMQNFSRPPSQPSTVDRSSAPQSPRAEDGDSSENAAGTASPSPQQTASIPAHLAVDFTIGALRSILAEYDEKKGFFRKKEGGWHILFGFTFWTVITPIILAFVPSRTAPMRQLAKLIDGKDDKTVVNEDMKTSLKTLLQGNKKFLLTNRPAKQTGIALQTLEKELNKPSDMRAASP